MSRRETQRSQCRDQAPDSGSSEVCVCVCVSLPAIVQLVAPREGGWLVLVPSERNSGFYTMAKAKRGGGARGTIESLSSSQLAPS